MARTGMVPVFYNPDVDTAKAVLKACFDGGVRLFEFANRGPAAREVFKSLAEYVPANLPELILGAGTVMDREAAERVKVILSGEGSDELFGGYVI